MDTLALHDPHPTAISGGPSLRPDPLPGLRFPRVAHCEALSLNLQRHLEEKYLNAFHLSNCGKGLSAAAGP